MCNGISPRWSEVKPQGFYVYEHYLDGSASPFYVGKGCRKRGWAKRSGRNSDWASLSEGKSVTIRVVADGLSDAEAYRIEADLIQIWLFSGSDLANISMGGSGPSGFASSKRKMVFSSLGEAFESVTDATRHLNLNGYPSAVGSNIGSCCNGRQSFAYGRAWSFFGIPDHPAETKWAEVNARKVMERCSKHVFSSKGEKFNSVADAVRHLRSNGYPSASQGTISRAVKMGSVSYDRSWSFSGAPREMGLSSSESWMKAVSIPVETDCGMSFPSLRAARDWAFSTGWDGASISGISKCLRGKQKTAFGKQWRKSDGS